MTSDFRIVENIVQKFLPRVPSIQLCVLQHGKRIYRKEFGFLDPETKQQQTTADTRFDMASVSKLFTTSAFMSLAEQGLIDLDTRVSDILSDFSRLRPVAPYEAPLEEGSFLDVSAGHLQKVDAGKITFRQLLSHSGGLPAWRPLYLLANRTAAQWAVLSTYFSYQPGERVVYSDFDLILTGFALEALTGQRLDEIITERVCKPLGLLKTGFWPYPDPDVIGLPPAPSAQELSIEGGFAPTEICRWRKRRLTGEVHDENSGRLGGISGHAGIFSTADDIAALGQSYLEPGVLLKKETITEMIRQHSPDGQSVRRGIGFDLWVNDPETSAYALSPSSFGHTGFTGTSLWIDPERQLVIALLTNEVYYGRVGRSIFELRKSIHQAVVDTVK